jgi:pyruvate/2-oxoglutarate dehydrogenase complex dihydrolipoamide dehydrogenase (E3) component
LQVHLQQYKTTGAELIMGTGRFVAPKRLEVRLNDDGARELAGEQVFLNIGTHAAIPSVPGLEAARPLTHIWQTFHMGGSETPFSSTRP